MMRVPEFAFKFCGALRGVKASANPSVTRVELKMERDARKLAKLEGLSGSGEPFGAHTIFDEKLARRARSAVATRSWLLVEGGPGRLKARNALTGLFGPRPARFAAARMLAIRKSAAPEDDRVKLKPL